MTDQSLAILQTVRDWLRFAVSRFTEAKLVYGHGTSSAFDEAAFLVLTGLHLPHDTLEPWLDAKLTLAERKTLADLIETRVVTRKPASYLVKRAWMGPYVFYCDERVIIPRSFLGELLIARLAGVVDDDEAPVRVLDLCAGSGCLAIIAAHVFPDAVVDAAEISGDALDVARCNVRDHGLEDRVHLRGGDLFGAVGDDRYDLILSNPPYVTSAAVAAFPPEYKAEPAMAHDGGGDGLMLVRRILADAGRHLMPGGKLVVEVGQERAAIEAAFPDLALLWLDTDESEGEVFAIDAAALQLLQSPGLARSRRSKKR
jgi:ribosomal protein L3 glutamine methyltransferase